MSKKKKSGIASLLPMAVACLPLGAGSLWLVVGLIIGICSKFDADAIKAPLFWILAGTLFLVGLVAVIVLKIKEKNGENKNESC